MITIISGTNRADNNTRKVALEYLRLLRAKNVDACLLALDEVDVHQRNTAFISMEQQYIIPAQKFIIIMPEYNGSYPGILKLMMDNTEIKTCWWHKKVLLTGVSTGRAGNLRGMEHLTGSLLHLKMLVHPNRLPISVVNTLMDGNHQFFQEATLNAINTQLDEFISF